MYWRPNVDSSKVESLLNTTGVTLKDILKEDGVINEVQVYNEKLLNYLVTPDHISEMLNILISKPQPNEDGVLFFSEQNVVSEILSSYVNVIYSTLSSNIEYLQILFKPFLTTEITTENEEPINSVTCSLIFKVAKVLCNQSSDKLLNFLMSSNGILDQFVKYIEYNSISEFLIKCIQCFQPNEVLINYLKWLSKEDITGKLLANIHTSSETEVCNKSLQCLADLLSAVKSSKVDNPLYADLQNTRVVTHILSMMLTVSASRMSMITNGLEFIKSIFEIPEKQSLSSFTSPIYQTYKKTSINSQDILDSPNLYNPIIDCLVIKFADFKSILEDTSELTKIRIPTAYGGEIVGPLGPHRLALIDLLHHLVLLEQNRMYYEIINSDIISTLLKLFFEFHLNTFLHRFVTEIINKLISYSSETFNTNNSSNSFGNISEKILKEIIVKQDILNKIVITWNKTLTSVNGSTMLIRNTHRPFLKEIANNIEKHLNVFSSIIDQDTLNSWKAFSETCLAEENKKNITKKKNFSMYPDSSSEGESATEVVDDIDNEDTFKIYEDCIQQEMTPNFPDYNYKPIFLPEKNSLESELNSNPLTDFFVSTLEDIENAENFESVCNVMLTTKMPCDSFVEPNECITNDMDFTLTNDVENIEEIFENNFIKTSSVQTNMIDSVFREAYKDLNQPSKHHEIKIFDNRSSMNQKDSLNNRFQFRTGTGLPITSKQRKCWSTDPSKAELMGDNILINSTVVPRLKFGDMDVKIEAPKSSFIHNFGVMRTTNSFDKETNSGSPFSIDEEDETPLCSTARYIPNEKSSDFSDESDEDDVPLSSRLEKGQSKLSENLSQLDNQLDDKTWNNPSNNESVNSDHVELEYDTVQDVTPDLVLTHCNNASSAVSNVNCTENDDTITPVPVPINTCIRSVDNESIIKSIEPDSVANVEVYEIENSFSPKLIRHFILNTNKESGLNKTKLFESSKCLTLSSNNKSNKTVDFKPNSTPLSSSSSSRHTFSSILCPLPWTSFQKINRPISAPIKLNINNETETASFHNPETTKVKSLVNGLDESEPSSTNL